MTKNSTIISWIPGKPNNSRKKGSKQKNTEKVEAAQTNFSCFNFIKKETIFRKKRKDVLTSKLTDFLKVYTTVVYTTNTLLQFSYHSSKLFFSQFTVRCLEEKRARNKNVLRFSSLLINNVSWQYRQKKCIMYVREKSKSQANQSTDTVLTVSNLYSQRSQPLIFIFYNSKTTYVGHLPAASQYRLKGNNTQKQVCFWQQDGHRNTEKVSEML